MNLPLLARLAVPYARLELPGWGRVLRAAGVLDDDATGRWADAPTVTVRGKLHRYQMTLDLSNWSERRTFFLARFYDLPTQLFVKQFVRLGDSFVDVGGNIGMITLLAARRVGASGRVHTFEPNPAAFERLRAAIEANALAHVTARPLALSDAPGELTLSVLHNHTGMGTLAPLPEKDRAKVTGHYTVPVARGDDVLPPRLRGPLTIKIDVEGYECHALRGLGATIDRLRPAVVAEALPQTLSRAGESVESLCGLMHCHGYATYALDLAPAGLRYRLGLAPVPPGTTPTSSNLVFIHPDSEHGHRLEAWRRGR